MCSLLSLPCKDGPFLTITNFWICAFVFQLFPRRANNNISSQVWVVLDRQKESIVGNHRLKEIDWCTATKPHHQWWVSVNCRSAHLFGLCFGVCSLHWPIIFVAQILQFGLACLRFNLAWPIWALKFSLNLQKANLEKLGLDPSSLRHPLGCPHTP